MNNNPLGSILKTTYFTGADDLVADIFVPCLRASRSYKRTAGFFSSSALVSWAAALPDFLANADCEIRLVISQHLTEGDYETLKAHASEQKQEYLSDKVESYLDQAVALAERPENLDLRMNLFSSLLASGKLQLKFAFMEGGENGPGGDYHGKVGIYEFLDGKKLAFNGSANETLNSHKEQGEVINVFKSEDFAQPVSELEAYFDQLWSDRDPVTRVYKPREDVLKRCVIRLSDRNTGPGVGVNKNIELDRWQHQREALNIFLDKKRGILEMATGTGKTRTSLTIAKSLYERNEVGAIIIAMEGNDLLDQWFGDLSQWILGLEGWILFKNYRNDRQLDQFLMRREKVCILTKTEYLKEALESFASDRTHKIIVIHDEVHGLGAPGHVKRLSGLHSRAEYVLGLSATPEREYDDTGSEFLENEIGPVLFQFSIEEAIKRRVLCPFDYCAFEYRLTVSDKRRIQNVFARRTARLREGKPMKDKEVAIEVSRVYKTAKEKVDVFKDVVAKNPGLLKNTIVFVETVEFGDKLLPVIHQYTERYRTYYADDDKEHLHKFARGDLDCLVSCHRLSQGIDIPKLENVILISSSKGRLETIQRIGRCLRTDPRNPNKVARVVDFTLEKEPDSTREHADQKRARWLEGLATIRPESADG